MHHIFGAPLNRLYTVSSPDPSEAGAYWGKPHIYKVYVNFVCRSVRSVMNGNLQMWY